MPFDPQPVLRGPTIALRPLQAADFVAVYAVARDPLLWAQHPDTDRHRPDVFQAFFADALACGGALVAVTNDGDIIGSSRFHGYDEQRSEVEIGWTFLARSHWGGATNGELKRLMLQHAFRFVERVVFLVGPENRRSQRALEKLGTTRVGTCLDEGGQPSVLFELRRPDFPPSFEARHQAPQSSAAGLNEARAAPGAARPRPAEPTRPAPGRSHRASG